MSGNSEYWTGADEMGVERDRMRRLPPSLLGNRLRDDIGHPAFGEWQLFACDALLPFYRRTAVDATPDDRARFRRLLREQIAVYARGRRGARFLDKTHAYSVKVSLIAALLEDADPFFVLVLRNPYGACPWIVRRKPPTLRFLLTYEEQLQLVAEHWANTHEAVLEDASTVPHICAVRFEDFLARPRETIEALCGFIQLEFDPQMVPQAGQPLPFATLPGDRKWYPLYENDRLENLTPVEIATVSRRCEGLADRFGYSARGAEPRPTMIEQLTAAQPGSSSTAVRSSPRRR